MGSVKDLVVIKKPEAFEPGLGNFIFSDRYSVFDWGEMPNQIANKGKSLCLIGAYLFEKLADTGVETHYLGVVEDGECKKLSELSAAADTMQVKLVRVIKPDLREGEYDYSAYHSGMTNFLIPLEIIYRNALPEGSSVFARLRNKTLRLADIGLERMPLPGHKLSTPVLDVSSKLEATDRYLTWPEAREMAGLNDGEVQAIKQATLKINRLITAETQRLGLFHEDGKVEFAMNEASQLMLVDVLGTPDECRFTFDDIPVSKEALRIHYRQTDWYKAVEAAKRRDRSRWKTLVKNPPPRLPEKLDKLISQLYMAFCNELTGRQWFKTPALKDTLLELKSVLPAETDSHSAIR